MSDDFRKNLLGPEPTLLPAEVDVQARLDAGDEAVDLAAANPTSSLLWAILADEAYAEGRTIESYAYARTGYHRGLDALRRNGWRGTGPVPFEHEATADSCVRCTRWAVLQVLSASPMKLPALPRS